MGIDQSGCAAMHSHEGGNVPCTGSRTHPIIKPIPVAVKQVGSSKRSAPCISRGQSSSVLSDPLHPTAVTTASGTTLSGLTDGTRPRKRAGSAGNTVPAPNPSWRQATLASGPSKAFAQTWLQEPSKNTSRRPTCQLASVERSTSLTSPSSARNANSQACQALNRITEHINDMVGPYWYDMG